MTLDREVREFLQRGEELGLRPVEELTPAEARAQNEAGAAALFGPTEEVASVEEFEVAGVRVRSYRPSAEPGLPILVYFHGGGWVVGSLDTFDGVCRALANRAPNLGGAAPALIAVCEYDPLRDEGVAYARRLEEARVPVRLSEYPGMIHGFVRMAAVTDRSRELLDESAAGLREAFSKA